jgi:hypothetical protein
MYREYPEKPSILPCVKRGRGPRSAGMVLEAGKIKTQAVLKRRAASFCRCPLVAACNVRATIEGGNSAGK